MLTVYFWGSTTSISPGAGGSTSYAQVTAGTQVTVQTQVSCTGNTDGGGGPVPTGTITFEDKSPESHRVRVLWAPNSANTYAVATLTFTATTTIADVWASYSGDSIYWDAATAGSGSSGIRHLQPAPTPTLPLRHPASQFYVQSTPTVSLTASPNPASIGDPVTLNATGLQQQWNTVWQRRVSR